MIEDNRPIGYASESKIAGVSKAVGATPTIYQRLEELYGKIREVQEGVKDLAVLLDPILTPAEKETLNEVRSNNSGSGESILAMVIRDRIDDLNNIQNAINFIKHRISL